MFTQGFLQLRPSIFTQIQNPLRYMFSSTQIAQIDASIRENKNVGQPLPGFTDFKANEIINVERSMRPASANISKRVAMGMAHPGLNAFRIQNQLFLFPIVFILSHLLSSDHQIRTDILNTYSGNIPKYLEYIMKCTRVGSLKGFGRVDSVVFGTEYQLCLSCAGLRGSILDIQYLQTRQGLIDALNFLRDCCELSEEQRNTYFPKGEFVKVPFSSGSVTLCGLNCTRDGSVSWSPGCDYRRSCPWAEHIYIAKVINCQLFDTSSGSLLSLDNLSHTYTFTMDVPSTMVRIICDLVTGTDLDSRDLVSGEKTGREVSQSPSSSTSEVKEFKDSKGRNQRFTDLPKSGGSKHYRKIGKFGGQGGKSHNVGDGVQKVISDTINAFIKSLKTNNVSPEFIMGY